MNISDAIWCGDANITLKRTDTQIYYAGITVAYFPCISFIVPAVAVVSEHWTQDLLRLALYAKSMTVPMIRLPRNTDRPFAMVVNVHGLDDIKWLVDNFWNIVASKYSRVASSLQSVAQPMAVGRRPECSYRHSDHFYI